MDKKEWEEIKRQAIINNTENHMLIHGYLRAVHDYVFHFGLENTAAYLLSRSGIIKEDMIKCQLESGWENEKMLALIEKAFAINPQDQQEKQDEETFYRNNDTGPESRTQFLLKKKRQFKPWDKNFVPKVNFYYDAFAESLAKRKNKIAKNEY